MNMINFLISSLVNIFIFTIALLNLAYVIYLMVTITKRNPIIFTNEDKDIFVGLILANVKLEVYENTISIYNLIRNERELGYYLRFWDKWFKSHVPYHLRLFVPELIEILRNYMGYYQCIKVGPLPCSIDLINIFYPKGKMAIPKNILNYLTPIALLHWIKLKGRYTQKGGISIDTTMYTIKEAKYLSYALYKNFGIPCVFHNRVKNDERVVVIHIKPEFVPLIKNLNEIDLIKIEYVEDDI